MFSHRSDAMVLEIEEVVDDVGPVSVAVQRLLDASRRKPDVDRAMWILLCTRRLLELRPGADALGLADLARDMWTDVSAFDPALAAEMEHECALA